MSLLNKNWSSLIKPSKIVYDASNNEDNVANIIIEPLERGFGLTIGNALRRVLLSSLQGFAITGIKILGVEHEFSIKSGVKEDMIDIILNLKNIALRLHDAEHKIIKFKAQGPCVVTAGMMDSHADVEVLNPNHKICTLSQDAELEIEVYCSRGRGYIPAHNIEHSDTSIGVIAIDALFSPVKKVSYNVEDTRVGQATDYDKLTMRIETDGSLTPEIAIALAARILQDQLQLFITFEDDIDEQQDAQETLEYNPILLKKVDELELSVRSRNCLQNDNIVYIGDLVNKTEADMLRTQNFGRKSLNEIKDVLSRFDLKFGMDIAQWPPEDIEELSKKYDDSY